jgi:TRAP-type C4-dicarboxylate transport system substrate-binding protein
MAGHRHGRSGPACDRRHPPLGEMTMRTFRFAATVAGSIAFALGAQLGAASAQQTISLRLGSGHPVQAVEYTIAAQKFLVPELVRRAKEAGITLQVQELHGGTVAKLTEVFEATRDGLLDIGLWAFVFEPTDAYLQNFNMYLPFNSPDPLKVSQATRKTFEKFPELRTVYERRHNQKLLGVACVGNYGLGTSFTWDKVEELKGKKIAGAGANLNWIVGATAVASNLNEAYQAIQSGVYQGYIIFPGSWYGFKLHEVGKQFMNTDFGSMAIIAVAINLDTWKKLPPALQKIVEEVAKEYEIETAKTCVDFGVRGEKQLKDAGVAVKSLSAPEKTAWCELLKGWPNSMAQEAKKRGLPGPEVMSFYIKTIEEMGHKFPCKYDISLK